MKKTIIKNFDTALKLTNDLKKQDELGYAPPSVKGTNTRLAFSQMTFNHARYNKTHDWIELNHKLDEYNTACICSLLISNFKSASKTIERVTYPNIEGQGYSVFEDITYVIEFDGTDETVVLKATRSYSND